MTELAAVHASLPADPREQGSVRIQNVDKLYPVRDGTTVALKDVNLAISGGEFVSILGPSGCGKSTLLRCIGGLDRPTNGTITLGGEAIDAPPLDMGFVFQRDVLLDWLTVIENVLLPCQIKKLPTKEWTPRAKTLLEFVGLGGFELSHPWELSGGMRQRVAICRALLLNPSLLLMDEPFGALDAMTRDELNLEMQDVWLAKKNTVLFVTHSISEAVFLADRVVVMSRSPGKIAEVITIEMPRPRSLADRETPEFTSYTAHIRLFESFGILRGAHAVK
jgi:NitT/TauT family transport system ATP-binding protein